MQNAAVKMGRNEHGGRIFAAALLISLIWHIFWLSAVKIVAASKEYGPVKFSKVSFLGPILESGSVEMRVAPKSRSLLEQKPMNMLPKDYYASGARMQEPYAAYRVVEDSGISGNDKLNSLIDKVLGEQKPEPSSKEIY